MLFKFLLSLTFFSFSIVNSMNLVINQVKKLGLNKIQPFSKTQIASLNDKDDFVSLTKIIKVSVFQSFKSLTIALMK